MHDNVFDRYHERKSLVHRLDPRVKLVATVVFIFGNAFLPDGAWLAFFCCWLVILLANHLSQMGLFFTFKRSFVALPFALAALTAIVSIPGRPLAEWHIAWLTLVPTDAGLLRFASILVRSWLSIQMAILLVAVTRFPDLLHAFEHLRVPRILTTIVAFLYRYMFVLTDEVFRLLRAREARSAGLPGVKKGGSITWRARVTGSMVGQLFLRSYERSDRIYNAMLSRGYSGDLRTLHPHVMLRRDWLILALFLIILVLVQFIGWIR